MRTIEKCFDEGTIQAFLDGELASDLLETVACHVSACETCATALAFAEEESAFAFAALDTELNALVPTERIRTRLFETIEAERASFWQRIFGKGFRWSNPSVAAFASLLLVFGISGTLWIARQNSNQSLMAVNNDNASTKPTPPPSSPAKAEETKSADNSVIPAPLATGQDNNAVELPPPVQPTLAKARNVERIQAQKAVYVVPERTVNASRTPVIPPDVARPEVRDTIVGEESYIRTIATLKQTIDSRKDELMRPSARVAFERDMAVVDDAITKMRREVRKNPRNQAAREMLRASYQNKIDLLNSVAEKSELMAALD
jgi:hypothetical protein